MWSEARRSWVSALVGSGLTVVIVTAWVLIHPGDSAVAGPLGTVLTWAILVSVHAFLTLRAFGGLSGDDLETAVDASGLVRQANRIRPSWSVQVSSMALVVVALLVVVPAWRDHASSWPWSW